MTAAGLEHALGELHDGLEGLLSCLDARATPEPAVIDVAWLHVQRGFERVRGELEGLAGSREPFQERVDRCLRLYAVAAGVLARQRDELAAARATCSTLRSRLRQAQPPCAGGTSVDLSG